MIAAAATSTESGTARMAMEMEMGSLVSVTMDGELDFDTGDSAFTMDMGGLGALGGVDPGELVFEIRSIDGTMYLHLPALLAGSVSDAEWIAVDLDAVLAEQGLSDETIASLTEQADPSAYLQFLRGASDDIEVVGTEEVRDETTTHYQGTLDLGAALGDLPDEVDELLDERLGADASNQLTAMFEQLGLDALPYDVWIDDAGRMRRLEMTLDLGELLDASGDTGGMVPGFDGEVSMVFELYDYGAELDLEAPPAADVERVDLADLARLGG